MTGEEMQAIERKDRQDEFLTVYAETGVIYHTCKMVGVNARTVRNWRRDDPEFRRRFWEAKQLAGDALEMEARRRAFQGSDSLLIFMLKGNRPHKFREIRQVYNVHGGKVEIGGKIEKLTDEQLEKIVLEGMQQRAH